MFEITSAKLANRLPGWMTDTRCLRFICIGLILLSMWG